jgi:hypothetical protein
MIPTSLEKNLASPSKLFEQTATDNCLMYVNMLFKEIFLKIEGLDRF